jgi:uncharacterized protein YcfJ
MHDAAFNAIASIMALGTIAAAASGGYRALDRTRYAEVVLVRPVTTTEQVIGHSCGWQAADTCQPTDDSRRERLGYYVTYLLDGQEHVVRLDYDPGKRIFIEDGRLILKDLRALQR